MNNLNSNFKVLFISINNVWRYGNIGMDQLAGYLREQGYNVDIKYFSNRSNLNDIISNIDMNYDLYGFSVNSSNYKKCCDIARQIKKINNNAIIDFGGGYPTRYYKEILLETDFVDYMILGDGEEPTKYLFDVLSNSKAKGISPNVNHKSIVSPNNSDNKIDFFNCEIKHFPAFDYYKIDTESRNSRKVHCIQTKNNVCTGNCSFCTERHGKIVYKSIDSIISQIKYVHENYGVKKFFFTDDNILDPNNNYAKDRMFELCNEIKKLNYKLAFQCYIKAISIEDSPKDNELLSLMKEVGFVEVFVGIESGNQSDLNLYNKHTCVEDNYRVISLIKKHGMFSIMGFIAFNPYSTRMNIKENFEFLCNVECTYLFNYLYSFVVINKYTDLYEKICKDNLLLDSSDKYLDVKYSYQNNEVVEVLDYVRNEMLPRLIELQYELDWVTYSYMEHKIWYDNTRDFSDELKKLKEVDLSVIKKYLSILFIEFNVSKFKTVENEFWQHFIDNEEHLKNIYEYLIGLHY